MAVEDRVHFRDIVDDHANRTTLDRKLGSAVFGAAVYDTAREALDPVLSSDLTMIEKVDKGAHWYAELYGTWQSADVVSATTQAVLADSRLPRLAFGKDF